MTDHIELLREYNEWRRGEGDPGQYDFAQGRIGTAIDAAIAEIERLRGIEKSAIKTLAENGHLADGDCCTLLDLRIAVEGA